MEISKFPKILGELSMHKQCVPGSFFSGADFMEISKFPKILGELSMHKQCVPGSFFSAHALEPGNEATTEPNRYVLVR